MMRSMPKVASAARNGGVVKMPLVVIHTWSKTARLIEEAAVGCAVDQRAEEAQVLHAARKLNGAGVRALHRQHGKAREALRKFDDRRRQIIFHLARQRDAVGAGHEIGAGGGI